jgi:hypothetical protein
MTAAIFDITPKEVKEQKRWLIVTVVYKFILPLLLFAISASLFEKNECPPEVVSELLRNVFLGLISLWIFWHCAYKKNGTKLLTLFLVLSPIIVAKDLMRSLKESTDPWTLGLLILGLSLYIYWYIFSLKLKRINQKIKAGKCTEYADSIIPRPLRLCEKFSACQVN